MANQGPFGFGSDDFDKFAREATEGLREVVGSLFASNVGAPKAPPEPETTGQKGDGVWAIYSVDDAGSPHVDQLYATELDALRAHKDNTDPRRRVRFLPYGVSVSVLED